MTPKDNQYKPGLAGIPAAESSISYIDGDKGVLEYRGFPIETLAEKSSFEEVCWLLLHGKLPTSKELDGLRAELAEARRLPDAVLEIVRSLPRDGHPMAALQASIAALGTMQERVDPHDVRASEVACIRLIAATPVLIAAYDAHRAGRDLPEPDAGLDTAANFLWMINGAAPDDLSARVLDVALVLHADHTMNASTFAARVVASTEADPYSVCASAVGALYGPLHGGANERVLNQLEAIGSTDAVPSWVEEQLGAKGKVMGFGHRVYKTKDPRAPILQGLTRELFGKRGTTPIYDIALALEDEVTRRLGEKGIYPNVDFFSGIVYQELGIATDLFTPVFAMSRVAGWMAHWREQMQDNRIFRPRQVFVGGHGATYTDVASR